MKTLPDRPHLDHLRQQAKQLLAGLRDIDPTTTLTQAQAALADQYGFAGWPELKAEVDRRRDCGEVADLALARELARRYELGAVTGQMRSVSRPDYIGEHWSLTTDRGRWSVRTLDHWHPIVDVEVEMTLRRSATAAGIALPSAIRSRDGAIIESISGRSWRVEQWPHSGPPLAAPVSAAVTGAIGTTLARLHGLALPVDRISPYHAQRLLDRDWPALTAAARAQGAEWADALAAATPDLIALEAFGEDATASAPVLCHNNLIPGCVRLGPAGSLLICGWEHAGGQPPEWELGQALLHWTIDPGGAVNRAAARAMVEGYQAESGTLPPLGPAMFGGAVISHGNYVSGQVQEALAARAEEDRRYTARSVRHLLAHQPSPAHLEELLAVALATARG